MASADFPILIPAADIQQAVARLGARITADYGERDPLLLGVLNGAFIFLADLMRAIPLPVQVDFIRVASYGDGRQSRCAVDLLYQPPTALAGRHVVLVEDIVDTGHTIEFLLDYCRAAGAASVSLCALLVKGEPDAFPFRIAYWGIRVPPEFVVGYGLDLAGRYRGLPDVRVAPAAAGG